MSTLAIHKTGTELVALLEKKEWNLYDNEVLTQLARLPYDPVNQTYVYREIRKRLALSDEAIEYIVIDYLKSYDTERFQWHELRQQTDMAFSWCIDKILTKTGTSVLVAPPKCGKSTLIRWLLYCFLTGRPFLGYAVTPCDCVYYVAEESVAAVRKLFLLLEASQGLIPAERSFHLVVGAPSARLFLKEMDEYAAQGVKFFVIDPLFDALNVTSSNDYVEMNRALKAIRRIAQRHAVHVLGVHHTNKGGENRDSATGILGSQAIRGSSDCNLWMRGSKADPRTFSSENRYAGLLGGHNFDNLALSLLEDGSIRVDSAATARHEMFPKLRQVYQVLQLVLTQHPEPVNRTDLKRSLAGTDAEKLEAVAYAVELDLLVEMPGKQGAKLVAVPETYRDHPSSLMDEFSRLCEQHDCALEDFVEETPAS